MDAQQRREPSSVVVVLSEDVELGKKLPERIEALDPSIELHLVKTPEALRAHLASLRPDLVVLDAPGAAMRHAAGAVDGQTPLVVVGEGLAGDGALEASTIAHVPRDERLGEELAQTVVRACRITTLSGRGDERHYHGILEAAGDGIFVLVEDHFLYVNQIFAEALGSTPMAMLGGKGLVDFVPEAERSRVHDELARVFAGGGRRELLDVPLLVIDGREARFEIACRSSVIEGRRAVVGVARDVTAAVQLAEEIERARRRAAQVERLRALGELAAGVAHDFNNAIATILGRAGLIRQKQERGEPVDDDVQVIQAAAKNAGEVAQRIKDFARPAGTDTWQDVDLEAVVRDAGEFVRTRVPPSVRFVVEVDRAPRIQGNGAELREVMVNLLRNALDAVTEGGTVAIRCFTEDEKAVIVVEDDGHGMPEAVQQRIFEPFFTTKAERGTGLGLSVSHGILRRHDAQIHLSSEPGKGTRFRLVFAPFKTGGKQGVKLDKDVLDILVVDDDKNVAEMMRDILIEHGHRVEVAHHPSDAAQLLGARAADLMITDLDLPGMSGWQLARKVRELKPDILVGLMTGWSIGVTEEQLRARGVDFALSKPFSLEALSAALRRLRG